MLIDPPAADVLEISIFGPGKGECVAVHLGFGDWIIVDSCIDQFDKTIPVLNYLDNIGVDIATSVRLVVATHAHDDHFAGISRVFERSSSARFVCSSAVTREEFFALVEIDSMQPTMRARARIEYRRIFDISEDRGLSPKGLTPIMHAMEGRPLLTLPVGNRPPGVVRSLSPSDEAFRRSLTALAKAYPVSGQARRAQVIDPNELAVALWIEVADKAILLGADLLNGPSGCGWSAILAAFDPGFKASLFKIPHHGAPNAHNEDVWDRLLVSSPVALLAPYRAGKQPRPGPDDVVRICTLTPDAFITAAPSLPALSRATRREAAALGPLAKKVREPWGRSGHVRARSPIGNDDWSVEFSAPGRP